MSAECTWEYIPKEQQKRTDFMILIERGPALLEVLFHQGPNGLYHDPIEQLEEHKNIQEIFGEQNCAWALHHLLNQYNLIVVHVDPSADLEKQLKFVANQHLKH